MALAGGMGGGVLGGGMGGTSQPVTLSPTNEGDSVTGDFSIRLHLVFSSSIVGQKTSHIK